MSGWSSLLESEFLEKPQKHIDKTGQNQLCQVSSVPPMGILKKRTFFNEGQKGQEGNINDAGQNIKSI